MLPFPTLIADYRAIAADIAAVEAFAKNVEVATGRSFNPIAALGVLTPALKSGGLPGFLLALVSNAGAIFPPYVAPPATPPANA
jgi:hypothetical protein